MSEGCGKIFIDENGNDAPCKLLYVDRVKPEPHLCPECQKKNNSQGNVNDKLQTQNITAEKGKLNVASGISLDTSKKNNSPQTKSHQATEKLTSFNESQSKNQENKTADTSKIKETCECWNIEGYGIDGICSVCHREALKKQSDEFKKKVEEFIKRLNNICDKRGVVEKSDIKWTSKEIFSEELKLNARKEQNASNLINTEDKK